MGFAENHGQRGINVERNGQGSDWSAHHFGSIHRCYECFSNTAHIWRTHRYNFQFCCSSLHKCEKKKIISFADEVYGINQSTVHFPVENFSSSDENTLQSSVSDKKTIILNSGEELYTELRDKHLNAIGQILSRRANEISKQLDERHNDKSVQDIKKFVERLPNMMAYKKSLATHTTIAELLKEITASDAFLDDLVECEQEILLCTDVDKVNPYIEDLIANQAPFKTVIRLICMQSIAGSGLKQKVFDYYKRELVQVYGIERLLAISNLEKAGLLKVQAGSRTYAVARKVNSVEILVNFR